MQNKIYLKKFASKLSCKQIARLATVYSKTTPTVIMH